MRVLLIDDHALFRIGLQELLEEHLQHQGKRGGWSLQLVGRKCSVLFLSLQHHRGGVMVKGGQQE